MTFRQYCILRLTTFSLLGFLTFSLSLPGTSFARKECSPNDPEYSDTGKRIKCKMENMTESFDELITTATGEDTGLFTEKQKKLLNDLKERTRNETERVHHTDYKRHAKKDMRDVECVIRERIGDVTDDYDLNGNGVCDEDEICLGNEDGVCQEDEFVFDAPYKGGCAEVLDDGIGDDDGICDPRGASGKFREECLQDCSQDVILAENEEKNVDKGKSDDVEQAFEDMTEVMDEANTDLQRMVETRRVLLESKLLPEQDPLTACEDLLNLMDEGRRIESLGLAFATSTASSAKIIEDACKDTLQFDAIVTASAACVPTTLVGEGLNILAVRLEAIDDAQTGERIDAIGECVQTTGGEIKEVKQLMISIRQMLLQPQGQRF